MKYQLASFPELPEHVMAALKARGVFVCYEKGGLSISLDDPTEDGASTYKREPQTARHREHFNVAASFGRPFTAAEFNQEYRKRHPNRPASSILPADFSLPSSPSARNLPKFLRRHGDLYELIPDDEGENHDRLKKEFMKQVLADIKECRTFGYDPTCFMQMVENRNGDYVQATVACVMDSSVPSGLTRLWEENKLRLSLEARVCEPGFAPLFDQEIIDRARSRLTEYQRKK
jgi:hypothetical protein